MADPPSSRLRPLAVSDAAQPRSLVVLRLATAMLLIALTCFGSLLSFKYTRRAEIVAVRRPLLRCKGTVTTASSSASAFGSLPCPWKATQLLLFSKKDHRRLHLHHACTQFVSRYADACDQLQMNLNGSVASKVKAAEAMAVEFTPPPVASEQPLFFPDFMVRIAFASCRAGRSCKSTVDPSSAAHSTAGRLGRGL